MLVLYACVEMLESPTLAFLWQSKSIQARICGIFIDEAHEIAENGHWRPSYTRIHKLCALLNKDIDTANYYIPFVAISATAPTIYRQAVVVHAGLRPDYKLINLGNFRRELFSVVMPMQYDANSFQDIAFVLPFGATTESLIETLIYTDDLNLLTDMFWWFTARLASASLPTYLVDIIHAGLSAAHQEKCLHDFCSGHTKILLGSQKIGAGMNFPKVP
jgi:superfamily II DNA helicase RecQ